MDAKDLLKPVEGLIDKAEEFLGHSPHPAVVTVPIGAWGVSNFCDAMALATGERGYDDAARISMGIGLAGAGVAVVTGLRDYASIPTSRPSHEIATRHALGNAIVGSLFAASYMMRLAGHAQGRPASAGARLLALAGGGLALYTAWLGGVLVAEHGEGVKPVMEHQSRNEGSSDRFERASDFRRARFEPIRSS